MAKIKHIAILTENPERLADFYRSVFDMKEVKRLAIPGGAIYLSDGNINLSIIKKKDIPDHQRPLGIYHFGFHIDELEVIRERLRKAGISDEAGTRPRDGRYAEFRITDPDGNPIDIAEKGWEV